jgi:hydroxyacylglutathione hydrolase
MNTQTTLQIAPIAAFTDNYIWAIHNDRDAWLVDPGDAAPVLAWLQQQRLALAGVLVTHHHPDHIGGLAELCAAAPAAIIIGPDNPRIAHLTRPVEDGDDVELLGHRFQVMRVPGHTLDHIAFYCADHVPPLLFCGDTLFAAGCGRLFEGTPEQMWQSLQRLAALPGDTRIYCAHEYTLSNLRFALAVEPDNPDLLRRYYETKAQRAAGQPTLPSTMALERATNPFLRVAEPAVRKRARDRQPAVCDDATVFAALRRWKDQF